jgi:hypothetical protein
MLLTLRLHKKPLIYGEFVCTFTLATMIATVSGLRVCVGDIRNYVQLNGLDDEIVAIVDYSLYPINNFRN